VVEFGERRSSASPAITAISRLSGRNALVRLFFALFHPVGALAR